MGGTRTKHCAADEKRNCMQQRMACFNSNCHIGPIGCIQEVGRTFEAMLACVSAILVFKAMLAFEAMLVLEAMLAFEARLALDAMLECDCDAIASLLSAIVSQIWD